MLNTALYFYGSLRIFFFPDEKKLINAVYLHASYTKKSPKWICALHFDVIKRF